MKQKTISSIPATKLQSMGYNTQILVVDGNSTDKTREQAIKAGAEVIVEPRHGYGRAFKTGFAHAKGNIIATVDADATYPVEDLSKLVETLEQERLDFLTTNRFASMGKDAMTLRNKIGNTILSLEVRLLFGLRMRDPESGMWVFRKDILNKLRLGSDIWPFSHEIKLEACYFRKYRWREMPIHYKARSGQTKLTGGWKVGFTDLFHIMKKRLVR